MKVRSQRRIVGALGLCFLTGSFFAFAEISRDTRLATSVEIGTGRSVRRSPFGQALWDAAHWDQRALKVTADTREALEGWDPQAGSRTGALAGWREWEQQMAGDPAGCLHRALAQARLAAALARTPEETYRATAMLALLECRIGRHDLELRQARRLMALEPRDERSLLWLRRAARCNGLKSVERHAGSELAALAHRSRRGAYPPLLSQHPPAFGRQTDTEPVEFTRSDLSTHPARNPNIPP